MNDFKQNGLKEVRMKACKILLLSDELNLWITVAPEDPASMS